MDPGLLAGYRRDRGRVHGKDARPARPRESGVQSREYFEAHELWEDAWRELDGRERTFVQGLIQIAAGLHHLHQQRPRPATELLRKGVAKLSSDVVPLPVELHVDALVRGVERLLANLGTPGAEAPDLTFPEI